jgi:hypothetical protein
MKKAKTVFVSKKDCVKKLERLSSHSSLKPHDDMGIYFLEKERVFATTNYATIIFCDVSLFSPGKDILGGAYSFLPDGTPVKTGEIPERKTHRWGEYLAKGVLDMGTHLVCDKNIVINKTNLEKGIDIQEIILKTGKKISMKELAYIPEGEYRVKTPLGDEVTYIFTSVAHSPEDDSRPLVVAAVCYYC